MPSSVRPSCDRTPRAEDLRIIGQVTDVAGLVAAPLAQRIEDELDRMRRALANLIEFSGLSRREVGQRLLENGCGTDLGRLLSGRLELKMKHILALCRVIGLEPVELFEIVLKPRTRDRSPLLRRIEALLPYATVDAGSPAPAPCAAGLQRRMQELADGLYELARDVARLDPLDGAVGDPIWDCDLGR